MFQYFHSGIYKPLYYLLFFLLEKELYFLNSIHKIFEKELLLLEKILEGCQDIARWLLGGWAWGTSAWIGGTSSRSPGNLVGYFRLQCQ